MACKARWIVLSIAIVFGLTCYGQDQPLPKRYRVTGESATTGPNHFETDVTGEQQWTDTGIRLQPGTRLQITASGSLQYAEGQSASPDGLSRGWKDLLRVLPMANLGRGALIGRVGSDSASMPFAIGSSHEVRTAFGGNLFLGINQGTNEPSQGSYHVVIDITGRDPNAAATALSFTPETATVTALAGIDREVLERIPRRVGDSDGNPGDMVNFVVLGGEDLVKKAFNASGWVAVDRTKKDAMIHGLIATLSKQAYTELPMSELYLFGRPQDYGYAHAEPFAVVASRHHLRIWKAPFDVNGQTLWVGAATHDVGFDKDQRNGGVTHKIDPNIDDERKFLAETFAQTGLVGKLGYIVPPHPLQEARTATGGSFRSDGKVLVLVLNPLP